MHSPTSSDACVNIVHSLMLYRKTPQSDISETNFSKKAIESLVKKLKEKKEELDSLITAVTTNGNTPSLCVTINRTLDGRLQVASRKGFPHVIYSRVWRWPDVHKNELKHLSHCTFAFDLKQEFICVNPYHYERASNADPPGLSGLSLQPYSVVSSSDVSMHSPLESTSLNNNNNNNNITDRCEVNNNNNNSLQTTTTTNINTISPDNKHLFFNNNNNIDIDSSVTLFTPTQAASDDIKPDLFNLTSGACMLATNTESIFPSQLSSTSLIFQPSQQSSLSPPLAQQQSLLSPQLPPPVTTYQQQQQQQPLQQHSNGNPASTLSAFDSTDHAFEDDYLCSSPPDDVNTSIPKSVLFNRPLPEYWCSITYFELDQKVGEICKVPSSVSSITVDGYTNPSSPDRFCLGLLTNVHRTDSIEKARLYIGKGVQLVLQGEGDVWVRCLSEHSIFVQSYYLDREAGRSPGDAVHKIYPAAFIKVFDLEQCRSQMELLVRQAGGRAASVVNNYHTPSEASLTPALSLSRSHSIGADELRRLSVLRLSYVKGWGLDYPRPTIKDTPCWIEVQLFRPLQFLDDFLQSMPPSSQA